jgi:glyoxylase-like metal-dependent hydrolase (beta-lactamase superfamily II)
MIEVVEDKLLFTGDNATAMRVPRMDDGTYKGSIAAMDRALKLDSVVVVPGHGPTGDKRVLTDFRELLSTVYGEAKKYREDGKEDFEMKPMVLAKLERWKKWEGFDEAVGKWLSLAVIEIDAE